MSSRPSRWATIIASTYEGRADEAAGLLGPALPGAAGLRGTAEYEALLAGREEPADVHGVASRDGQGGVAERNVGATAARRRRAGGTSDQVVGRATSASSRVATRSSPAVAAAG